MLSSDFKAKDIQVMFLPNFKDMSIESLLEFGKTNPMNAHYLPDARDIHKVPR